MLGLMGDKKKMISTILMGSAHKGESKEVEGVEEDYLPALKAIAADMIAAHESKDAAKLAMAMKEFIAVCEEEPHVEGEHEEA